MMQVSRIEVTPRLMEGMKDVRGDVIRRQMAQDLSIEVTDVRSIVGYLVNSDVNQNDIYARVDDIFCDPIIEKGYGGNPALNDEHLFNESPDLTISIAFKAGVTDNPGSAALDGFFTIFPQASKESKVATYITYAFYGIPENCDTNNLAKSLHNSLIQRAIIGTKEQCLAKEYPEIEFIQKSPTEYKSPAKVDLEISDEELIKLSEEGLLALNLEEMQTIQAHYRNPEVRSAREALGLPPDAPTDVELECLAQTWSEHCKHKIFAAKISHKDLETGEESVIDSLFKTHIMKPTLDMQKEVDWLLSVFHDNSGVIAWDDEHSICMKAETHNSPSALDPYGGAMTGIVGVNRDILGTGLGARPIANTDVFCFGPPDYQGDLPENLFHPSRVLRGVHAGVRTGGNESGIPTVNGAIVFDDRFIGKPLVYCGTVGLMPQNLPDGSQATSRPQRQATSYSW